jgi:hypothetical protein
MILDRIFRLFYLLDIPTPKAKSIPKDPEEIVSTSMAFILFTVPLP